MRPIKSTVVSADRLRHINVVLDFRASAGSRRGVLPDFAMRTGRTQPHGLVPGRTVRRSAFLAAQLQSSQFIAGPNRSVILVAPNVFNGSNSADRETTRGWPEWAPSRPSPRSRSDANRSMGLTAGARFPSCGALRLPSPRLRRGRDFLFRPASGLLLLG